MSSEQILISGIIALASAIGSLGAIIYGTALWLRKNIAEPAIKSHLELVGKLTTELPKQTALLLSIAKSNKKIEKGFKVSGDEDENGESL